MASNKTEAVSVCKSEARHKTKGDLYLMLKVRQWQKIYRGVHRCKLDHGRIEKNVHGDFLNQTQ